MQIAPLAYLCVAVSAIGGHATAQQSNYIIAESTVDETVHFKGLVIAICNSGNGWGATYNVGSSKIVLYTQSKNGPLIIQLAGARTQGKGSSPAPHILTRTEECKIAGGDGFAKNFAVDGGYQVTDFRGTDAANDVWHIDFEGNLRTGAYYAILMEPKSPIPGVPVQDIFEFTSDKSEKVKLGAPETSIYITQASSGFQIPDDMPDLHTLKPYSYFGFPELSVK